MAMAFSVTLGLLLLTLGFAVDLQELETKISGPKEDLLRGLLWPSAWPLRSEHLQRMDESEDQEFYGQARLVTHIDDAAIGALRRYYEVHFHAGAAVLDLCSSWISHFPAVRLARAVGIGMNADELARNEQLTEWTVKDLNKDPTLNFEDETFDFVVNAVSVDYLVHPLEIFKEMLRVLKPGGMAIMGFSNRFFGTKAIKLWLEISELQRCQVVSWYFHFAGFRQIRAKEITAKGGRDPMYVVEGVKAPISDEL
ncbi:unnamed protein product [Cladocopium goreaui]|uniref:Methyltransf_11 domain-containing protein n=2 Tax=Cladocopium goreaui TaxID=2562237 RepID=A0A9P1CEL3_9DINO|nr:unnamed protein product [Cladocopium goreaui]